MARRSKPQDRLFALRLMEHLVVSTFVLDPQGCVIIWNRACERLTGVRASDVVGTNEHWKAFYEQPRPCLADLVLQGTSGVSLYRELYPDPRDAAHLSAENWCVMPVVGARRYLSLDAGAIYSERGELLAVVETLRDITAQHEAQTALAALASQDGLTGLANRRTFDQVLDQECRRSHRDGHPLSLLMIDVDNFKQFNDAGGHQAGDDCLRHLAKTIGGEVLRPGDLACRYGGEEFTVILPATPLDGAMVVADRLLATVQALELPHPSSPDWIVTVSIGVTSSGDRNEHTPEGLIAEADSALFCAKRGGRDRVVAASFPLPETALG